MESLNQFLKSQYHPCCRCIGIHFLEQVVLKVVDHVESTTYLQVFLLDAQHQETMFSNSETGSISTMNHRGLSGVDFSSKVFRSRIPRGKVTIPFVDRPEQYLQHEVVCNSNDSRGSNLQPSSRHASYFLPDNYEHRPNGSCHQQRVENMDRHRVLTSSANT